MVSLSFFFLFLVALFAMVGAMRGWAKEMLVTFSLILALFIITVIERYVPVVSEMLPQTGTQALFWLRFLIVVLLVFFGYQSPNLTKLASARFARERLQDALLGLFLGALNGFLIAGTLWHYLHVAEYPFPYITPPVENTPLGDAAIRLLPWLPPRWLGIPAIFYAIAIAFVFVIIVFI